jgi:hypothetical protein
MSMEESLRRLGEIKDEEAKILTHLSNSMKSEGNQLTAIVNLVDEITQLNNDFVRSGSIGGGMPSDKVNPIIEKNVGIQVLNIIIQENKQNINIQKVTSIDKLKIFESYIFFMKLIMLYLKANESLIVNVDSVDSVTKKASNILNFFSFFHDMLTKVSEIEALKKSFDADNATFKDIDSFLEIAKSTPLKNIFK